MMGKTLFPLNSKYGFNFQKKELDKKIGSNRLVSWKIEISL